MSTPSDALAAVLPVLRCPLCRQSLRPADGQIRCTSGHGFDLARQGYLNLTGGRRGPGTGDSAEMIAARVRFLGGDHYLPIAATLAGLVGEFLPPEWGEAREPVVDCGGGTGYYLRQIVEELLDRPGLCLDLSVPALRRAARAHPQIAAVGADAWQPLPLADESISALTSVFAPRNLPEVARCLVPGGLFAVVTPEPEHLGELVGPLALIGIDPGKQERLENQLTGFEQVAERTVGYQAPLLHEHLADLVLMGPSAHHLSPDDIIARIRRLPEPMPVTVSVRLAAHRKL